MLLCEELEVRLHEDTLRFFGVARSLLKNTLWGDGLFLLYDTSSLFFKGTRLASRVYNAWETLFTRVSLIRLKDRPTLFKASLPRFSGVQHEVT